MNAPDRLTRPVDKQILHALEEIAAGIEDLKERDVNSRKADVGPLDQQIRRGLDGAVRELPKVRSASADQALREGRPGDESVQRLLGDGPEGVRGSGQATKGTSGVSGSSARDTARFGRRRLGEDVPLWFSRDVVHGPSRYADLRVGAVVQYRRVLKKTRVVDKGSGRERILWLPRDFVGGDALVHDGYRVGVVTGRRRARNVEVDETNPRGYRFIEQVDLVKVTWHIAYEADSVALEDLEFLP